MLHITSATAKLTPMSPPAQTLLIHLVASAINETEANFGCYVQPSHPTPPPLPSHVPVLLARLVLARTASYSPQCVSGLKVETGPSVKILQPRTWCHPEQVLAAVHRLSWHAGGRSTIPSSHTQIQLASKLGRKWLINLSNISD